MKGEMNQITSSKKDGPKMNINVLEGAGVDDLKYLDQHKKLILINYLKDKIEAEKKE